MVEDTDRKQAPFNMALNTLESLRNWIDKITELSVGIINGIKIDMNEMIIIKHRMVKQLILLSIPLLGEKQLEEIEDFYKDIKLKRGDIKDSNGWKRNVIIYTQEVDYILDECVHGIEKALQEEGHFMPQPDESALF